MRDFLTKGWHGLLAAVLAGAAGWFMLPEHYQMLGAFAGMATMLGAYVGEWLKKLALKLLS